MSVRPGVHGNPVLEDVGFLEIREWNFMYVVTDTTTVARDSMVNDPRDLLVGMMPGVDAEMQRARDRRVAGRMPPLGVAGRMPDNELGRRPALGDSDVGCRSS